MNEPDYTRTADDDESVVKVNASPWGGWLAILLRQIGLMGGAVTAVFQFVAARDIKGLFQYITTHEFVAAVVLIVGAACLAWGHVKEWLAKKKLLLVSTLRPREVEVTGTLPGAKALSEEAKK